MFGESESESPRVPSPWDSLMSTSPSPAPKSRVPTPSPLATELAIIPRLVAESDDGNVEYKLQLLDPTPARFARLVTQLKWRLLEGGGQAYYEIGVADSGDLVGLPREELEQSLETLEMMAGEIGASVIVVKEIEVPAALARIAKRSGDSRRIQNDEDDDYSSSALSSFSNSDVDLTDEGDKEGSPGLYPSVFSMDSESESDAASTVRYSVDLEISSVFKPRPVRTKSTTENHLLVGGKTKRNNKKNKGLAPEDGYAESKQAKAQNRRQNRDRRREEKKKALMTLAAQSVGEDIPLISAPIPVPAAGTENDNLVSTLENLQFVDDAAASASSLTTVVVSATVTDAVPTISVVGGDEVEDDDDVFPTTAKQPLYPKFPSNSLAESHLDVDPTAVQLASSLSSNSPSEFDGQPRLIVEALVVRKMSLEEAFLDFGGFGII